MSPTATITVRVVKPCVVGGERIEAGRTLKLQPLAAGDMIDAGKAELAHADDREAIREAQRQEIRRALKAAGPLPRLPADGPWFPIGA